MEADRLEQLKRTLRVEISSKPMNQPWQVDLENLDIRVIAPKLEVVEGEEENGENGKSGENKLLDFATGKGVPSWELNISGEILGVSRERSCEKESTDELLFLEFNGWLGSHSRIIYSIRTTNCYRN